MTRGSLVITPLLLILLDYPALAQPMPLKDVRSWMYQLQNLEKPSAIDALARSRFDLLVVEPTATIKDQRQFDMKGMVAKLHAGRPGRLVLAYVNPGQAESYRTYWKADWKAPTRTAPGVPDFMLIPDPDGWNDNYNVAFWDRRWQEIFAISPASEVHQAMSAGFDGLYLDWIDAYNDERVVAAAKKVGVDPVKSMVDWLLLIRQTARQVNPQALIVQQNAFYLLNEDQRLAQAVDALGVEDTWFGGKANAKWGSKQAGDIPNRAKDESSIAARLAQYDKWLKAGKPVFTIDYCVKPENAAVVYREAARRHLVALVTQVSLDRMTETLPAEGK